MGNWLVEVSWAKRKVFGTSACAASLAKETTVQKKQDRNLTTLMCSRCYHSSTWKTLLGQCTHMHVHTHAQGKGSPHAHSTTAPKVLMLLKWLAVGYEAVTVTDSVHVRVCVWEGAVCVHVVLTKCQHSSSQDIFSSAYSFEQSFDSPNPTVQAFGLLLLFIY